MLSANFSSNSAISWRLLQNVFLFIGLGAKYIHIYVIKSHYQLQGAVVVMIV
jgi:hypothetical protein